MLYFSTFLRLEIERIFGDQDGGIGLALDSDEAADVGEGAAAGADVVMGFIGFEMLIFVIEDDVAARHRFVGLIVVFDVIGAEALIAVMDVDGVFGGGDVALVCLWAGGGDLGDAAFGRLTVLLGTRQRRAEDGRDCERGERCEREGERPQKRIRARRGEIPGTGIAIHAEHSLNNVNR